MGQIAPSKLISSRPWRVQVEGYVETEGPSGGPVWDWLPLGEPIFMSKDTYLASERYSADQVSARAYVRFVAPYDPRLDPDVLDVPKTRRLKFKSRAYDIQTAERAGVQGAMIELTTLASSSVEQPQR